MTLRISFPAIFTQGVEERILAGVERFQTDWRDAFNADRTARPYLTASAGGFATYAVDLGTGITATADHLILSHIGTYSGVSSIAAYNSNTSISAGYGGVNQIVVSTPIGLSRVGPKFEDYFVAASMATPARYWAVELTASNAFPLKLGKIYLGLGLDLGREPIYQFERVPVSKSKALTTGGTYERGKSSEYIYRFRFEWERITDALTQTFFDRIAERATRDRFYLYTTTNHHILNEERLVHVRLLSASSDNSSQKKDYNTIIAEFEEIIG